MKKKKLLPLINREISWLHFNARVLQEAADELTPLIERIKFLGIFSNNRDEFYRIRVATINRLINLDKKDYHIDFDARKLLEEIKNIVGNQEKLFAEIYLDLVDKLKKENIFIINEKQLTRKQGIFVRTYFLENLRSFLFPVMLENLHSNNILRDKSIYLVVVLKDSRGKIKKNYSLIKIPTRSISRFLILPSENEKTYIILLDDVIRFCLGDIFSFLGYDTFEAYTFKFTRDAELDIDNDVSKSFLEVMSESLKQRETGAPVRFVYDESIPADVLRKLFRHINITKTDNVKSGGRYHNFKDFMAFPRVGPDHLFFPPFPPLRHEALPHNKSIFEAIKNKDILLHFPYHSFDYIIDWLREASIDPKVSSIKMTFYRAARYSNVVNALINAARNGKSVTVFLELQARFDEEANIILTEKFKAEGVKIIQTIPDYKVHSKLLVIRRNEEGKNIYYADISTGNFNENTAGVYSDISLLTANQPIAKEVDKVFELFETRYHPPEFKQLIVSPFKTREIFIKLLNNEINNARAGKEAWAIIKLNNIVDRKIAEKLYHASQAGVKLTLISRATCVLIPGLKGISENIEAFGIVDRFLEHSRAMVFCDNGNHKYFISSADWMPRNFDHRIEVTVPITDPGLKQQLWDILQLQIQDNCKSRNISHSHPNTYRNRNQQGKRNRAQYDTYEYFRKKIQ